MLQYPETEVMDSGLRICTAMKQKGKSMAIAIHAMTCADTKSLSALDGDHDCLPVGPCKYDFLHHMQCK